MSKKIMIPILLVLGSLLTGSTAMAQEDRPPQRPKRGRRSFGQVTIISDDWFTIRNRRENEHTLLVNEDTRFRSKDGEERTYDDLQTGQWVAGVASYNSLGELVARVVVTLEEDYDPSQRLGRRVRGRVSSVDSSADTFSLKTSLGEEQTFQVDGKTIYRGVVQSLSDIEPGMIATVGALEQDDGTLTAVAVLARFQLVKKAGTVVAVDPTDGTFDLHTRRGEDLTYVANENTRYRSQNGSVQSLSDLQPEMFAVVVGKKQPEDESYVAMMVAAGSPEKLPKFDLRMRGQIALVGEDYFILEARDGEQNLFHVTEESRFRSRGGIVRGLEDLRIGMIAIVGARSLDDAGVGIIGQYQAQVVLVIRHPRFTGFNKSQTGWSHFTERALPT